MRGKTIKMIDESNITLQQAFEEFLDLKRSLKKFFLFLLSYSKCRKPVLNQGFA